MHTIIPIAQMKGEKGGNRLNVINFHTECQSLHEGQEDLFLAFYTQRIVILSVGVQYPSSFCFEHDTPSNAVLDEHDFGININRHYAPRSLLLLFPAGQSTHAYHINNIDKFHLNSFLILCACFRRRETFISA